MCKVLVTGSSGFVGTNLIPYLIEWNFKVVAFSRNLGLDYQNIDSDFIDQNQIECVIHLTGKAHDLNNSIDKEEYFQANSELTINIFDQFLNSNAKTFIFISSIKALADKASEPLTEDMEPKPATIYGLSKLSAEKYLLSKKNYSNKNIYILRPSMIHGPGNKGNLNLLYKFIKKGIPYPLAAFDSKRSFLSIENFCFVIKELLIQKNVNSGIYHICDDEPISINTIIKIMSDNLNKPILMVKVPKYILKFIALLGDKLPFFLNTRRLNKMTENFLVNNDKVVKAIGKPLPVSAIQGLKIAIDSLAHVN